MDILTDILQSIQFETCLYFRATLTAPWGIRVPSYQNVVRFHITLHGNFFVKIKDNQSELRSQPGDVILIPQGREHDLYDSAGSEIKSFDQVINEAPEYVPSEVLNFGNPKGKSVQIVCGHFSFNQSNLHPFFHKLPEVLHYKANENRELNWLNESLNFLSYESHQKRPGDQAVMRRLSEIIFIQVVRNALLKDSNNEHFLAALKDQYISRALEVIHADYRRKWTISTLAQAAGLSRSVFAQRFVKLTDLTPMEYLTKWRMERAKRLLEDGALSTAQVGEQVGYNADESFQKTFKKLIGITPSHFRKSLAKKHSSPQSKK